MSFMIAFFVGALLVTKVVLGTCVAVFIVVEFYHLVFNKGG